MGKPIFEIFDTCEICGHNDRWFNEGWTDDGGRVDFYRCRGEYESGDDHMVSCDQKATLMNLDPKKFNQELTP